MGRQAQLVIFACAVFGGCNVFVNEDLGRLGESCALDGSCKPGLVCGYAEICVEELQKGQSCNPLFDDDKRGVCLGGLICNCVAAPISGARTCAATCQEAGADGQPCIYNLTYSNFDDAYCNDNFICEDGICVWDGEGWPDTEWPDTETQGTGGSDPGTDLSTGTIGALEFDLCPKGMIWDGTECSGTYTPYSAALADQACTLGSRLPTRQEIEELLLGCKAVSQPGDCYQIVESCGSCSVSPTCNAVFPYRMYDFWLASNSGATTDDTGTANDGREAADLTKGEVHLYEPACTAVMLAVYCVRDVL